MNEEEIKQLMDSLNQLPIDNSSYEELYKGGKPSKKKMRRNKKSKLFVPYHPIPRCCKSQDLTVYQGKRYCTSCGKSM